MHVHGRRPSALRRLPHGRAFYVPCSPSRLFRHTSASVIFQKFYPALSASTTSSFHQALSGFLPKHVVVVRLAQPVFFLDVGLDQQSSSMWRKMYSVHSAWFAEQGVQGVRWTGCRVLCCVVLCCVALRCVVLCCVVLRYVVLWCGCVVEPVSSRPKLKAHMTLSLVICLRFFLRASSISKFETAFAHIKGTQNVTGQDTRIHWPTQPMHAALTCDPHASHSLVFRGQLHVCTFHCDKQRVPWSSDASGQHSCHPPVTSTNCKALSTPHCSTPRPRGWCAGRQKTNILVRPSRVENTHNDYPPPSSICPPPQGDYVLGPKPDLSTTTTL